jgi:Rap1a immunity proteins
MLSPCVCGWLATLRSRCRSGAPAREDAAALSPAELLTSCEAITSTASRSEKNTLDIPAEGLPCWYYMSAIQNITALADERGERLFGVCPPPDSTLLDFVRIFVQHARTEDVEAQSYAAAFVLPGLAQAFPC